MTTISPSSKEASALHRSRRAGWSGVTFVVLLLLSAGMASAPHGTDSVSTVREFYGEHAGVVVVAQLLGLVAAVAFAVHAQALASLVSSRRSVPVSAAGTAVAASAGLTAVPVLVLAATVEHAPDRLVGAMARASDWTDVVLFTAVSLFALAAARASAGVWAGAMAGSVALLSIARAVLLAGGSSALSVAAPTAFLVLVTALSMRELTTGRRRGPQPQAHLLRKDPS